LAISKKKSLWSSAYLYQIRIEKKFLGISIGADVGFSICNYIFVIKRNFRLFGNIAYNRLKITLLLFRPLTNRLAVTYIYIRSSIISWWSRSGFLTHMRLREVVGIVG